VPSPPASLPSDLPVVDHHCHLSPSGEGVAAAERFAREGGTHLFLATQAYETRGPRRPEDYARQFETTEALGRQIRERVEIGVSLVVAPYPVDLVEQARALGLRAAVDLPVAGLELAGRWVRERRAVALGEVGRPHFPVDAPLAGAANEVLDRALGVARDAGCPAVLHSEELTAEGFAELAARADRLGLPREKLVKHYARDVLPPGSESGLAVSYLAARDLLERVGDRDGAWFLETDFLDDPRRPGAVLDLATVPRRARAWLAADPTRVDRLRTPFETAIERVYRVRPVSRERRVGGPA
jgi:TatD-related deoxyribonuclease